MMIDSSVLITILENEPEAAQLIEAITNDPTRLISAVSFFSYAAAVAHGEPLLFKGNDFGETDIPCCIDWKINRV